MSGRRSAPRILLTLAIVTMVVSIVGFIVTLILNVFVLDKYNAYGEVPIPGSGSLHLPAGEVTVTFHTVTVGGTSGSGLPIPRLGMTIDPPPGVADPAVTESIGSSTTVNNDARRRVWLAQIPVEGTYRITTDGDVSAFLEPRLAFGHPSAQGGLPWIFAGLFAVSLLDLVVASVWLSRVKRRAGQEVRLQEPPDFSTLTVTGQPTQSYTPTDDGVRIEQLKTLAALRDSGALTEEEFESEKRRVLRGG